MGDFYSTRHADSRLLERYGVQPTRHNWREALLAVTGGTSVLLARQSDGHERHLVQMAGVAVIAQYSPSRALFITVLPKNYSAIKGLELR